MYRNFNELNKAYGLDSPNKNRSDLTREEEIKYVNDCFDLYESIGFFHTMEHDGSYIGTAERDIIVICRVDIKGFSLEHLPAWFVRFNNGDIITASPEEICIAVKMKDISNFIDVKKFTEYLSEEKIMEFYSDEECMNYFNLYDGQNFKSIDELKEYQDVYGFNIGKRRFHINYDDALDVYKNNYCCSFTNEEIGILSEAMLDLINNTNKAITLVRNKKCIDALQNALQTYEKLNSKICNLLK